MFKFKEFDGKRYQLVFSKLMVVKCLINPYGHILYQSTLTSMYDAVNTDFKFLKTRIQICSSFFFFLMLTLV